MADLIGMVFQYGLPALALGFSAWVGVKGQRSTSKAQAEGAVAAEKIKAQTATEERLQAMLDAQKTQFIVPLQEELGRVKVEVATLTTHLESEKTQKWDAVGYIRSLLVWISNHLKEVPTPLPDAPNSIRHHVNQWSYPGSPSSAYMAPSPSEENPS